MNAFVQQHKDEVIGMLTGFDRLRIRGTIRWLASLRGISAFLGTTGILLKDFKDYALSLTAQVRDAITAMAEAARRPNRYLYSSSDRKELIAREIAQDDGVEQGLICVLRCVEPCWTYKIRRNPKIKHLELYGLRGKCEHYYSYYMHPILGFMHVRVQTWLPFTVHVCLNGREWLARQMDGEGVGYVRRANAFVAVDDVARAQGLLHRQVRQDWPALLDALLASAHPAHASMYGSARPLQYYWSIDESEWATDVLFRDSQTLAALYPRLIHYGVRCLGSCDVLRFLGRRVSADGHPRTNFSGEVLSDLKHRPEGVRLKHQVNRNSVKMYDKQGSVLRVETTINNPRDLRVYRAKEGNPSGPKAWRALRKGVCDTRRRAEISESANQRYLDALADAPTGPSLSDLTQRLCRPVRTKGRRLRGLNPLSAKDAMLLEAVNQGEFAIAGFRNRDIRRRLFGHDPSDARQRRCRSSAVTHQLRLLRAHGLIRKVTRTHRYIVTRKGRDAINTLLLARAADTDKLIAAA